tara:strand:+ start:334 stop:531 length:198 start_codon:yes stop_codon:yes gene_type:complete
LKETKMIIVQMLLNRLKEPSTLAGLGSVMAAIGISLPGEVVTQITVVIGALAGIAATMMKERGGE